MCVCVLSCSVVSNFLQPHGLQPARLLSPWGFSVKNIGVSCHLLLQRDIISSKKLKNKWRKVSEQPCAPYGFLIPLLAHSTGALQIQPCQLLCPLWRLRIDSVWRSLFLGSHSGKAHTWRDVWYTGGFRGWATPIPQPYLSAPHLMNTVAWRHLTGHPPPSPRPPRNSGSHWGTAWMAAGSGLGRFQTLG